ncbi:hypothetical protein V8F06_003161 [Rhypophila decipiens]
MRPLPVLLAVAGLLAPTPSHSAFIGGTAASLGNKELLKDQPPKENLYQTTISQQQQEQQVLLPDSIATRPEPGEPDTAAPASGINNSDDDDNKQKDPNPLPGWLNKYTPGFVAFGDSYSAGIGTSLPPGTEENSCRQGNGAYPYLIYSDFVAARHRHHDPNHTRNENDTTEGGGEPILQWLSCTGSRTNDVLATPGGSPGGNGNNNTSVSDSQIDMFNFTFPSSSGVKFATLSIGGNDVGFFDVINACVFRFYAFYSGTCEETLARTEKLISAALRWRSDSSAGFLSETISELRDRVAKEEDVRDARNKKDKDNDREGEDNKRGDKEDDDEDKKIDQEAQLLVHKIRLVLLEILDKVHWERNPDFRVIMTGYARFFNAETVQCDEVSLGVWSWDDDSSVPTARVTTAIGGNKNDDNINSGKDDERDSSNAATGDLKKRGGRHSKAHYIQPGMRQTRRKETEKAKGNTRNESPSTTSSLLTSPRLTRDTRKRMNHLVEGVNLLLHGIAGDVNTRFTGTTSKKANHIRTKKKVIFVNYDHLFEGHRFCEEGVTEPDFNRTQTWFFLPGGGDNNLPNKTTITSGGTFSQRQQYERRRQLLFLGTEESHLVDPETCLERITSSKGKEPLPPPGGTEQQPGAADWGEQALCYMALVKAKNPHHLVLDPSVLTKTTTRTENNREPARKNSQDDRESLHPLNRGGSMWYVPTYYGKTFHPRSLGHQVIRDRIYEVWGENEREGG